MTPFGPMGAESEGEYDPKYGKRIRRRPLGSKD